MKILLTSPAGNPEDDKTWSAAPAHMVQALRSLDLSVATLDSKTFGTGTRIKHAIGNVLTGNPWRQSARFGAARKLRADKVAEVARQQNVDLVFCTSTLDAPADRQIKYTIWLDNTWHLFATSLLGPGYSAAVNAEIDRLERLALGGAAHVFAFSEHVKADIVLHYGIAARNVTVIGCGSGPLPPFVGEKRIADGHLLFVAKHQFAQKGGELVLEAFQKIRKERPQTKLIVVGTEEARSKAAGMDGVEVHGFLSRSRLNELFYGASMLVQPMLGDSWGQVYLEAMKARAVVVALYVAALPELTDGGRLGVLIPKPDPDLLADAVLATYSQPQTKIDILTAEAQIRVGKLYDWDVIAKRVLTDIETLLT